MLVKQSRVQRSFDCLLYILGNTFFVVFEPPSNLRINVGPAVFEVTVEDREPVILMTGKLIVMLAYGRITIENSEDMLLSTLASYLHATGATDLAITMSVGGRRVELDLAQLTEAA